VVGMTRSSARGENIVRSHEMGEGARGRHSVGRGKHWLHDSFRFDIVLGPPCSSHAMHGRVPGRLRTSWRGRSCRRIVVSGFVSLTLTPMLCSRFLSLRKNKKHGRLFNFFERSRTGSRHAYDRCLQVVFGINSPHSVSALCCGKKLI